MCVCVCVCVCIQELSEEQELALALQMSMQGAGMQGLLEQAMETGPSTVEAEVLHVYTVHTFLHMMCIYLCRRLMVTKKWKRQLVMIVMKP